MLDWLTPPERRGATLLIALLLIGAGWDMWQAGREAPRPGAGGPRLPAPAGPPPVAATAPEDPGPAAGAGGTTAPRVDLNRAGASELDALPGIGPVLAARILEQRRRNGPFRRIEDLLAVRGIGPRLLERLRPHLRAGEPDPARVGNPGPAMQSAPPAAQKLADSTSVAPRRSR